MKINKLVQFNKNEVDITEVDAEVKALLKENCIIQKLVKDINVYIKPEAKYVVVTLADEEREFVLSNA